MNKNKEWEEEFDKEFPFRGLTDGDYYTMTDIKDFINQAILSAEERAVKKTIDEVRGRLTNRFGNYGNEERLEIFEGELTDIENRLLSLPDQERLSNTKTE